jgi:hypothetical protein
VRLGRKRVEMRIIKKTLENCRAVAVATCFFVLIGGAVLADQDRYALTAPNGIRFSEFRGYDQWQDVAVSATDTGIKAILANPVMIKAYKQGIPSNGGSFPDGSIIVKIQWYKVQNPVSPYSVQVPSTLKSVAFIEKDSKRFPNTSGWGYAEFDYDATSRTFKPYGSDSLFGQKVCYQCHTRVKDRDYIFTNFPPK